MANPRDDDQTRMNSLEYRRGAQQRAIDADRASRELAESGAAEAPKATPRRRAKKTTKK
jgi:hypothetical protein